jgi:acetolactate synthase-1/2/3 large subunit
MIKVSDFIAKRLKEKYEARYVFMVTGGGAMHLNDSFGKYLNYVCNHNEQASGIAAEGYARLNQELAVVNVTTGPGGLNTLNGLFGAWTDSAPVLFVSGQVKYETTMESCKDIPLRQLGDQEVDIIACVKSLCKYAVTIIDPKSVKYHLDRAIYEALHGRRGPVWLNVPINVQAALVDESEMEEFSIPEKPVSDLKTEQIIVQLKKAKRPVIVAGHGLRLAGQIANLKKLLQKAQIPVVTTLNGFDVIEDDHPCYIGRIGTVGQRAGNFALQNADCVLFLGTRNNIRQVSYNWENFAKRAFKIIVDIDQAELDKPTVHPDLAVCADLADFLPCLIERLEPITVDEWLKWCQERRIKYSFSNTDEYQQTGNHINAYAFTRRLTECLSENSRFVMANGFCCVGTFQTAVIKTGQRYLSNSGDASMGYDLPAAIGMCFASGKKEIVCYAGDGSIMMNIQELQTIKHHNLPIKIFVINNNGYLSIKMTQNNFFEGRHCGDGPSSGVTLPDFVAVAKAFGIRSFKVSDPAKVEMAIDTMMKTEGPALCEVVVNPEYTFSPKLSSRKLPDGTMVSPSLEDMFPFLDRKEFYENIIR